MDDEHVKRIIRSYLPQIIHMSLATVGPDGKPWVCEVHFAYDDDLTLYWVSEQTARHSREVAANRHVSGTIVTQHFMEQPPRGLSFEGIVEVLENVDTDHAAFKTYTARFPSRAPVVKEAYRQLTAEGRRIYKINVTDWYLNDALTTGKLEKHHLARA